MSLPYLYPYNTYRPTYYTFYELFICTVDESVMKVPITFFSAN